MGSIESAHDFQELPNKDSTDILLVVATSEEDTIQQQANSVEWRGALSLEAYLRREAHLSNQDLTKDGGLTSWLLVYQPEGGSKRLALCGCETIKKKALIGQGGKVEEVTAHGVCSVFCSPERRGKGYAGRMIMDLGKKLKSWQTDNGKQTLFSVLYSDIGKQFYAARGWQVFPSAHVSLPATASTVANGLPETRMIKAEDIPELCSVDEKLVRSRLSKVKGTSVALVPDIRTIGWHHARENFVANELFRGHPSVKGAVTGEQGSRVWCYWTRVWSNPKENTLHILRLVIEDGGFSDFEPASIENAAEAKSLPITKSVAAVFAAAQSEGEQWGMDELLLWNPTSTTLAAAQMLDPNASVEHREKESITSLLWYGEGSWKDVDWICNEKYAWC